MAGVVCAVIIIINVITTTTSSQVEEDPTGGKLASSTGRLNGAPHKLGAINHFHVGDTITAMQRASLQPGGQEVGGRVRECCRLHVAAGWLG
jgi:splicing factor 3B subunit 3